MGDGRCDCEELDVQVPWASANVEVSHVEEDLLDTSCCSVT